MEDERKLFLRVWDDGDSTDGSKKLAKARYDGYKVGRNQPTGTR